MTGWLFTEEGELLNLAHVHRFKIWTGAERVISVVALVPHAAAGQWLTVRTCKTKGDAEDFLAAIAHGRI